MERGCPDGRGSPLVGEKNRRRARPGVGMACVGGGRWAVGARFMDVVPVWGWCTRVSETRLRSDDEVMVGHRREIFCNGSNGSNTSPRRPGYGIQWY